MLLLLALVLPALSAPSARVLDDDSASWMGCLVEVGGRPVSTVDSESHFELPADALPARVRLVCVGERSPKLVVDALPVELDLRGGRAQARRWVLPREHLAASLQALDSRLPAVASAVGALSDAGTQATKGSTGDVLPAATHLQREVQALLQAVTLTDEQLDHDKDVRERHARVLTYVRGLLRHADAAVEHARNIQNPIALTLLAGDVTLLVAELTRYPTWATWVIGD